MNILVFPSGNICFSMKIWVFERLEQLEWLRGLADSSGETLPGPPALNVYKKAPVGDSHDQS